MVWHAGPGGGQFVPAGPGIPDLVDSAEETGSGGEDQEEDGASLTEAGGDDGRDLSKVD